MKLFSRLSIRPQLVVAAAFVCLVGAQHVVPLLGDQSAQSPQSQKSGMPSRVQKLSNPLNDLLSEAQQDIQQNKFEAAIAPLQKVIADQPDFAYAHFQLAYVYTALKRSSDARAEYTRTIAIDPKMSEAYLNLGMLLLDEQQNADAVAPLLKAVDLLPAESRPRYLLAVAFDRSGDRAGAAQSFEALLHLDPNDLTALNYLGWAALRDAKPDVAETRFRRAIEAQPKDVDAHRGLARALDAQHKTEAAAAAYRDYLALKPDDAEASSRLVHLLVDQKQSADALAELDRLEAGKKPTLESLKLRSDILIAGKKWEEAIVALQQAVALAPNDAPLHGGLGRTYLQKRDFPSAEKELRIALRLDPKGLVYLKDLGSTFYLSGNCPAAIAALDEIAKAETPGPGEWFIRALCYDKLNQPKPALEAYQKFLELDQDKNPDQVWQAQQRSKVLKRMLERSK
jgi:Flp pilus assembly protein TadD